MVSISEELIERMARRIVTEVDPEKVVLFGSWARGEDSRYHVVGRALKEGKVLYESDRCTS
jgi:predicted nucleotidyltransferase